MDFFLFQIEKNIYFNWEKVFSINYINTLQVDTEKCEDYIILLGEILNSFQILDVLTGP